MSKALLIVLDGFGIGKDSPFNAIRNARTPFFNTLFTKYPYSQLYTHGNAVGLPDGVMGNSEVGHATMGAGRVLYQDLTRISKTIQENKFSSLPRLKTFFETAKKNSNRVHFMGLLSDGGVHSHIDHLLAGLKAALSEKVSRIYIHAFLDGRDTSPKSCLSFLKKITDFISENEATSKIIIASLSGRYYAMDRDKRWDRVELAYNVLTGKAETMKNSATEILENSFNQGITDEFIVPVLLNQDGAIRNEDAVFFFNYRSDRAREITEAFLDPTFNSFPCGEKIKLSDYLCMTQYDPKSSAAFLFGPQSNANLFGELLEKNNKTQLRIAETEKYAHVTHFFNGGREKPFIGEDRILVNSPKEVATYDLKPEMSAGEITEKVKLAIESSKFDFILMNFANADMVGHTGNYEAALQAIETLDQCVEKVIGAAEKNGFNTLLTADHGNAEEMRECTHDHDGDHYSGIHTQHTLNPVPAVWVQPNSILSSKQYRLPLLDGTLADVMPTLCELMNISKPNEVTGKSLIK